MEAKSGRRFHFIVLACFLILGCVGYWLRSDSRTPVHTSSASIRATNKRSPIKAVTSPISGERSRSADAGKSPRAILNELLERDARKAFLVQRGLSIPLDPPDTPWGPWNEFWNFIMELKERLGDQAVPTLLEFINEAESGAWKELYLTMMVALRDPSAQSAFVAMSKNEEMPKSQRLIALYGLGMIGTSAAWESFQELWSELKKSKMESNLTKDLRWGAYAAMGAFGKPGSTLLLGEIQALIDAGQSGIAGWVLHWVRGADPESLLELVKDSPVRNVRFSAIYALGSELKSPANLSAIVELLIGATTPENRKTASGLLANRLRLGQFSFEKAPQDLERLIASFASLPPDLQMALYADPAARKLLPGTLEQFASDESLLKSDPSLRYALGAAMARDPSNHPLLARQIQEHWKDGSLMSAYIAFVSAGSLEFSDLDLARAVSKLANDPASQEARWMAWAVLSKGPAEIRQEALQKAEAAYWTQSETDRMTMARQLGGAGPDARQLLMGMMGKEASVLPRVELASTLLNSPSTSSQEIAFLRMEIAKDLGPVLRGESDLAFRYLSASQDRSSGIEKFAALIRDHYVTFGTTAQILEMKTLPDRIFVPQEIRERDPRLVERVTEKLREVILQCVDEIRRREALR